MKHIFTILLSVTTLCAAAQDSTSVNLHLDKLKMSKGEAVITTICGGLITTGGGVVAGLGAYKIATGETMHGALLTTTGGLFLGTGVTMTVIGGRKWRLHVKYGK